MPRVGGMDLTCLSTFLGCLWVSSFPPDFRGSRMNLTHFLSLRVLLWGSWGLLQCKSSHLLCCVKPPTCLQMAQALLTTGHLHLLFLFITLGLCSGATSADSLTPGGEAGPIPKTDSPLPPGGPCLLLRCFWRVSLRLQAAYSPIMPRQGVICPVREQE